MCRAPVASSLPGTDGPWSARPGRDRCGSGRWCPGGCRWRPTALIPALTADSSWRSGGVGVLVGDGLQHEAVQVEEEGGVEAGVVFGEELRLVHDLVAAP